MRYLASEPAVSFDAVFERVRQELSDFSGVAAVAPAGEFHGELRRYQREGLGWLHFLQRFGFGGCLADDMGLGKTVQVLALLEARRELRRTPGNVAPPSLVVVPRSLVFNWKQEAARFTPSCAFSTTPASARRKPGDISTSYDVILTTYGTLRRDVAALKDIRFDYSSSTKPRRSRTPARGRPRPRGCSRPIIAWR